MSDDNPGGLWLFGPRGSGPPNDPPNDPATSSEPEPSGAGTEPADEVQQPPDAVPPSSASAGNQPPEAPWVTNVSPEPRNEPVHADQSGWLYGNADPTSVSLGSSSASGGAPPFQQAPQPQGWTPGSPDQRRGKLPLLVVGVLVLGLAIGGGGFWLLNRNHGDSTPALPPAALSTTESQQATSPATNATSFTQDSTVPATADPTGSATTSSASASESDRSSQMTPSSAATTVSAEEQRRQADRVAQRAAQAELDSLAQEGLNEVALDGQWAAMIASKYDGVRDPLQETSKGKHVFHYADILAEHQELKNEDNLGTEVVLLRSTAYGRRIKAHGKVLYVTLALGSFSSKQEVLSWCPSRFADLSGARLANHCVATRLTD